MNESRPIGNPALEGGGVIAQPVEEPVTGPAAIVRRLGGELLAIAGVEGVGVGRGPTGDDAIVVYVRDASVAARVAPALGGLPTIVEVTGPIDALLDP